MTFETSLEKTVQWTLDHPEWLWWEKVPETLGISIKESVGVKDRFGG